ncbi:MAG: helix-turn-helix domain-containing protein [Synechococcus sp.]|nr:helix-turn-helix domain-containing protein [Synechococcus sp.]
MPPEDGQGTARRTLKKCASSPSVAIRDVARIEQALGAVLPVELTQLTGGTLLGELLPIDLGAVQLLRLRFDKPLHSAGAKPGDRQLIALDLREEPGPAGFRSHGVALPPTAFFGLAGAGEIHLTTPEHCSLALLSLDRHRFLQWALDQGCPGLEEVVLQANWQCIDPLRFRRVRLCLRRIFRLAEQEPARLRQPRTRQLLAGDLVPLMVEALAPHATPERLARPPARIELVKAAQRWMVEHPGEPISLDALCRELAAGRRSLLQGFQDHLGMGPMAYLKLRRLHGVHRELVAADPGATRISELAARWGFLNPGHFARDYRSLFGEAPSATLRSRG